MSIYGNGRFAGTDNMANVAGEYTAKEFSQGYMTANSSGADTTMEHGKHNTCSA